MSAVSLLFWCCCLGLCAAAQGLGADDIEEWKKMCQALVTRKLPDGDANKQEFDAVLQKFDDIRVTSYAVQGDSTLAMTMEKGSRVFDFSLDLNSAAANCVYGICAPNVDYKVENSNFDTSPGPRYSLSLPARIGIFLLCVLVAAIISAVHSCYKYIRRDVANGVTTSQEAMLSV